MADPLFVPYGRFFERNRSRTSYELKLRPPSIGEMATPYGKMVSAIWLNRKLPFRSEGKWTCSRDGSDGVVYFKSPEDAAALKLVLSLV